jgi:hypothetical protein
LTSGLRVFCVAVLLCVFMCLSAVPAYCLDARVGLRYPTTIYADTDIELIITVSNLGSKPIRVSKISVNFDWSPDLGYIVPGTPQTVDIGAKVEFPLRIHVLEEIPTNTEHAVTVRISASEPSSLGGWGSDKSADFRFTGFYVIKRTTQNPFDLISLLDSSKTILLAIIGVLILCPVVLLVTRSRKRSRTDRS